MARGHEYPIQHNPIIGHSAHAKSRLRERTRAAFVEPLERPPGRIRLRDRFRIERKRIDLEKTLRRRGLHAARGIAIGILLGGLFWFLIGLGIYAIYG